MMMNDEWDKKVLWFCWNFAHNFWIKQKFSQFSKICKIDFYSEENPTSTFKIGGISWKKMFRKFLETSVMISLKYAYSLYFEKKFQKFFKWKIFQLQVSKSGVFSEKKGSANFLKLWSYIVYRTYIHGILSKNFKNFFIGKKSNFKFQVKKKKSKSP